jgi:spermidine synthase
VLGVGGGAVIQLLHRFVQSAQILGVELDPTHIHIARRFFGITKEVAELVEADATDWLRRYEGPKFDLIIDDLFGEKDGEPIRAVTADRVWLRRLSSHLASNGVLIMNFISMRMLREAGRTLQQTVPSRFASSFSLSLPGYENTVGAFTTEARDARQLRRRLKTSGVALGARLSRLPYRIRRLSF